MSDYSELFLYTTADVRQVECIEVYHPSFSQDYRFNRQLRKGFTANIEDGSPVFFQYYPAIIKSNGARDNQDSSFDISLGDLGEIIPKELDNVALAGTFNIKPTVVYRLYRSDDPTKPIYPGLRLEVSNITTSEDGASFTAAAPRININGTGERYTIDRFPMLAAFQQ